MQKLWNTIVLYSAIFFQPQLRLRTTVMCMIIYVSRYSVLHVLSTRVALGFEFGGTHNFPHNPVKRCSNFNFYRKIIETSILIVHFAPFSCSNAAPAPEDMQYRSLDKSVSNFLYFKNSKSDVVLKNDYRIQSFRNPALVIASFEVQDWWKQELKALENKIQDSRAIETDVSNSRDYLEPKICKLCTKNSNF